MAETKKTKEEKSSNIQYEYIHRKVDEVLSSASDEVYDHNAPITDMHYLDVILEGANALTQEKLKRYEELCAQRTR